MKRRKVHFETLGCRYNRFETAEMAFELGEAGYVEAARGEPSDLVVINTCSVTAKSDSRCRAAIRKAQVEHPGAIVVVAGCYSETNPGAVAALEGVDLVLGNVDKFDLAKALAEITPGAGPVVHTGGRADGPLPVRPVTNLTGRTNAYLNVQGGCDEKCSFCVVRIARGGSRSADASEAVAQVGRMAATGIREVVLSGVNLGDYGKGGKETLATLVRRILDETTMPRIRFSSINPNTITDALIDLMAEEPRICRHLHIPLQSGSDTLLRRMRRPYTAADYERLLTKLVARTPDIGIGADLLVAFPGESDAEFEETRSLLDRHPFLMLHVFNFSPREGTEAATMTDMIDPQTAQKRSAILKEMSRRKREVFIDRFVGATLSLLVENRRDKEGRLKGFSANYIPLIMEGDESLLGTVQSVRAVRREGEKLVVEKI